MTPVDLSMSGSAYFLNRNAFRFEVKEKEDEELFLRGTAFPKKVFDLLCDRGKLDHV